MSSNTTNLDGFLYDIQILNNDPRQTDSVWLLARHTCRDALECLLLRRTLTQPLLTSQQLLLVHAHCKASLCHARSHSCRPVLQRSKELQLAALFAYHPLLLPSQDADAGPIVANPYAEVCTCFKPLPTSLQRIDYCWPGTC